MAKGKMMYCQYTEGDRYVCMTQHMSDTGFCQAHRPARGRKVSTEGKAARGTTPDSGSIPGCSTDNEIAVILEDMADLRERLEAAEKKIKTLQSEIVTIKMTPTLPVPMPPTIPNYNYDITYTKDGYITYRPPYAR